jgi:hypothetical protein
VKECGFWKGDLNMGDAALLERVERLERLNERLIRGIGLVGICLAIIIGMLAGVRVIRTPHAIRAEQFVVIDRQGRERAVFGMGRGTPSLELLSDTGEPIVVTPKQVSSR